MAATKFIATVISANPATLTTSSLITDLQALLPFTVTGTTVLSTTAPATPSAAAAATEFTLLPNSTTEINLSALLPQTIQLSLKHGVDIALQPDTVFRKHKRLVVFDMDSTLIQQEVIDEIARIAGVVDKVSKITEAAMQGEIDFQESLRRRVALLKGTPASVFEEVKKRITFTPGAVELCVALKKLGYKLAVISGGFIPLALYVKNHLGLDYAFANQLKVSEDGLTLTGETNGSIVDGLRKAELLNVISQATAVSRDQVIAVGDGANDLWMLAASGLGVAFNAKPKVQEKAAARINQSSLLNLLYYIGLTADEISTLLRP